MARTPFMEQYCRIKEQYQEYILLFRMGDFYEMFYDDAKEVSRELELVLTGKDCGEEQRAPMCGIPYHSVDGYISRLVKKGYKIAVCEQLEDPATAKGLVKRDVVRIITPGTVTDATMLDETTNNYLCSLYFDAQGVGVAFVDISTGALCATELVGEGYLERLRNELGTFMPRECLTNIPTMSLGEIGEFLMRRCHCMVTDNQQLRFDFHCAKRVIEEQFPQGGISAEEDNALLVCAIGALIDYIKETQKTDISYIHSAEVYRVGEFLEMDVNTRRNLELTQTMRNGEKRGSLLWVLDHTKTSMGARTLRQWVEQPLTDSVQIGRRQRAVEELVENVIDREELSLLLKGVLDLERLITKIVYNSAGPRDVRAIAETVRVLPQVRQHLANFEAPAIKRIYDELDEHADIVELVDAAMPESDLPFGIRDGGFIKKGYNARVDELTDILESGEGWKQKIEEREKEATGIGKLKVGYNKVFGYYIEVTNSYKDLVPETYIRKQTLTNAERYITQELKEMESTVLGAKDKLCALEYELFQEIRDHLNSCVDRIRKTAQLLGELDVYLSFAYVATRYDYVCPEVDNSRVIDIQDGRHPVVEQFSKDSYFVPNDTLLDTENNRMMMITGPNMAGKSTYMRQVALICVMAQIGSFVPARRARIGIVDRLFTRVGASDDLASGTSTFMLEMNEVAYILQNATQNSLIIYDEIGRGTSTFDGMSIARAVAEYTASKKLGAKTLFATHYHELTELERTVPGVVNYNIAAKKKGDDIIFLRKIVRGGTDDSYGIEVAKLAGIPKEVTNRAREVLAALISGESVPQKSAKKQEAAPREDMLSLDDYAMEDVRNQIRAVDLNVLTPLEAMNLIFDWKKTLQ